VEVFAGAGPIMSEFERRNKVKRTMFAVMVGLIMVLVVIPVYCQDNSSASAAAQEEQPEVSAPETAQPQAPAAAPAKETPSATQPQAAPVKESAGVKDTSIYGEVQSINAAGNSINVQYYDYDSDEEKTVEILVGKDTKLENATGINDIKAKNWVDVTYKNVDGKNLASSIAVEKEEEEAPAAQAAQEAASATKAAAGTEAAAEPPSEE
jgi:hypothetical protein